VPDLIVHVSWVIDGVGDFGERNVISANLYGVVLGGDAASKTPSSPKTWVAIVDIVAAAVILVFVVRWLRRPANPAKTEAAVAQMGKIADSPWIAVVGAGAMLANPGGFIPIALKTISQTDPTAAGYAAQWIAFTLVSLLPLLIALVLLVVARDWAMRLLQGARRWLMRNARIVAAVIIVALAVALVRNGIAGLA
jgi:hypothetical protein